MVFLPLERREELSLILRLFWAVFLPLWKRSAQDSSAHELNQKQILRLKWQQPEKFHKGEMLGRRKNKEIHNLLPMLTILPLNSAGIEARLVTCNVLNVQHNMAIPCLRPCPSLCVHSWVIHDLLYDTTTASGSLHRAEHSLAYVCISPALFHMNTELNIWLQGLKQSNRIAVLPRRLGTLPLTPMDNEL